MSRRTARHLAATLAALSLLLAACGDDGDRSGADTGSPTSGSPTSGSPRTSVQAPANVQTFPVPSRVHIQGPVSYAQTPPVGGDHNPVWQNCGFYSRPVAPERAVHSMEHGAVWVTYRPDLPANEVDRLRQLARSRAYVLVSPWNDGGLPAPVVASAWGVQLTLPSASDPALAGFVTTYAGRGNAPEPGAPCTGAFGAPE